MKLNVKQIIFGICILLFGAITFIPRSTITVQTDLTSLVSTHDSNWPTGNITDSFSSVASVIIKSKSETSANVVAEQFIAKLQDNNFPGFSNNHFSLREISNELVNHHGNLLSPQYRHLIKSGDTATITQNAINQISQSLTPTIAPLTQDPFLILTDYISALSTSSANWTPKNNMLWQYRHPFHYYLITLNMPSSANDDFLQHANLIKNAAKTLSTPDVQVLVAGAPMHTAHMVQHSKSELGLLSSLAIIAAIILAWLLFHHTSALLPIISCLFTGFVAGTTSLFFFFDTPHILVFVFGTTLIGLGIDYTFHFMTAASSDQGSSIRKNIFHSYLTTMLCFIPLLFSDLSLLQQISVFTITGITTIYLCMLIFMPRNLDLTPRHTNLPRPLTGSTRFYTLISICTIIFVCLPFTRIENNMSMLYRPTAELVSGDKLLSELSNVSATKFLLVRGPDLQSVLATEEEIKSRTPFFGISSIIPSITRQQENQQLIQKLYNEQLSTLVNELGLKQTPVFNTTSPLTPDNINSNFIKNWIQKLTITHNGKVYSISQVPLDFSTTHPDAKTLSPSDMLTNQISKYSTETYHLLTLCTVTLLGLLLILYGRRALHYLIPSILGIGLTIALLTIMGQPITFFHLLSLFIVIGLSLDYTIFHINSTNTSELRPVLFSFLSSFIGFGLLSFTTFFLIQSMGLTLGLGLGLSYLISFYMFRPNHHGQNT